MARVSGTNPEAEGQPSVRARLPASTVRVLASPAAPVSNPYIALLASQIEGLGVTVIPFGRWRAIRGDYDVLHIHWPEHVVARRRFARGLVDISLFLITIELARLRGVRVVWTVHNLAPHETHDARLDRFLYSGFTRLVDGYLALTEGGRRAAVARYPALASKLGFVVPHGHYRDSYPTTATRESARATLGVAANATVLLFFGQIRDYKNVPSLIAAVRAIDDPDLVLLIAGKSAKPRLRDEIQRGAAGDGRIRVFDEQIAEERLPIFFRAANLSVLPFGEILNSGSAILSLSLDVPILVPEVGAMTELQAQVGKEWVRTYPPPLRAADILASLPWAVRRSQDARAPLDALEWPAIARQTVDAYRTILSSR